MTDCDSVDVMRRRIPISTSRKKEPNEELIFNWQPFQIHGDRVVPCRIGTEIDGDNETGPILLPEINGLPMDDPAAKLIGAGDVFLNVKFTIGVGPDRKIIIDSSYHPNISFNGASSGPIEYTKDNSTLVKTITQPLVSWRLGSIGQNRPVENTMRYFGGYKKQWEDVVSDVDSIYRKGFWPDDYLGAENEWGIVRVGFIEDLAFTETRNIADPPLEIELPLFGGMSLLSNTALDEGADAGLNLTYFSSIFFTSPAIVTIVP